MENDDLTGRIIGAAIQVHRVIGPGLLESVYERCLAHELRKRGMGVECQVLVPIQYDDLTIPGALRVDLIVESKVIIEVKSIQAFERIHVAQLITYLKMTQSPVGLLVNFNVPLLPEGIKRVVL